MPVTIKKRGKRWRVIEAATGKLARNNAGTPIDGGGHRDKAGAQSQAQAVNASLSRRK